MKEPMDLTGQKFGRWTVLRFDKKDTYGTRWMCRCDCGNIASVLASNLRAGKSKSCGCLISEVRKQKLTEQREDLSGKTFGYLRVIEWAGVQKKYSMWKCQCICGNITMAPGTRLLNGSRTSCGCSHARRLSLLGKNAKDITKQKFGKLTALYPTDKRDITATIWHCLCDCGEYSDVSIHNLITGNTSSCGNCGLRSKGESRIKEILSQNNISFLREKTFDDCRFLDTNFKAKFDFYVDNKYIIEFDGIQHFSSKSGVWDRDDSLENRRTRDRYKNEWCHNNNIPIIRIPYTHLNDLSLEDLIPETSRFLLSV